MNYTMLKKTIQIILISIALLIPACQPKENIRVINVPNIELKISDNPYEEGYQPWVFNQFETKAWFNDQIEKVGARGVLFSPLLDGNYFVWEYDNAIKFLKEYRKSVWDIHYKSTARDCDDFAFDFKNWVQFNYADSYNLDAAIPVAIIFVNQKHEFGGVPAGGYHTLIGIATNQGVLIYEPQSGHYDTLENYPNAEWIFYIIR
jgi:hypothetical protein